MRDRNRKKGQIMTRIADESDRICRDLSHPNNGRYLHINWGGELHITGNIIKTYPFI